MLSRVIESYREERRLSQSLTLNYRPKEMIGGRQGPGKTSVRPVRKFPQFISLHKGLYELYFLSVTSCEVFVG